MLNNLMIKENKTAEEVKFVEEHNKILYYGSMAGQSIYNMGLSIKEIKDNKLYLLGGYNSLEEYTEENFNIKKSQAYNYINLVENVSNEFFQSTGNIGITKLLALSKLENEELAKEVVDNITEDTTVKELNDIIDKLNNDIKEKNKELKEALAAKEKLNNDYEQLELKLNDIPEEHKKEIEKKNEEISLKDSKINEQNAKIDVLQNQVNEISNSNYIKFTVIFTDLQRKFKDALAYLDNLEGDLKSDSKKALFSLLKQMEAKVN